MLTGDAAQVDLDRQPVAHARAAQNIDARSGADGVIDVLRR